MHDVYTAHLLLDHSLLVAVWNQGKVSVLGRTARLPSPGSSLPNACDGLFNCKHGPAWLGKDPDRHTR